MGVFRFLWDIIQTSAFILKTRGMLPTRKLLCTYLRLKLRQATFVKILGRRITSEKLFGFRVHFFDYPMFLYLFEEVFVKQDYYFKSSVPDPVILDCGSNIGLALLYFKTLYPQSTVLAFEPDRSTFEMLTRNVTVNNLQNVATHNKAIAGSKGIIDFFYDPQQPGSPRMSMDRERMLGASQKVGSLTLSSVIDRNVDFIKMDIEGAERVVMEELAGHGKLKLVRELVIEFHHHISAEEDRLSEMLKLLESNGMGYQIACAASGYFDARALQDILIRAYRKT